MTLRNRTYWLRLGLFFFVTTTIALISLPYLLGAITVWGLIYAPCFGDGPDPANFGINREAVLIPTRQGPGFRAFFIPSRNGVTIIHPPAVSNGRNSRWAETRLLVNQGYGLLTFEARRCAGLGPFTLGYAEIEQVAEALAYLQTRPDVDPNRIGIYGFSSAGATAIMAAARHPEIKAVAAEGGYGDFAADTLGEPRSGGLTGLVERGYIAAFRPVYEGATGLDLDRLSPVSVIDQIAPRPILLIYGDQEVSLAGGQAQYAAAGANAQLWIVPGAGHGNYSAVAPEQYEARLVGFFDAAFGVGENSE